MKILSITPFKLKTLPTKPGKGASQKEVDKWRKESDKAIRENNAITEECNQQVSAFLESLPGVISNIQSEIAELKKK